MIIEYLAKHPEIVAVLITAVVIPTMLMFLKNMKKALMLEFKDLMNTTLTKYNESVNNTLDHYDDILNKLTVRIQSFEVREETFQERVNLKVDDMELRLKDILQKVKEIHEVGEQSFQIANILQLQYNDLRSRMEIINNSSLRGKLGKDTEGDDL